MKARSAVLWFHRWCGLCTAVPLAIASFTGMVLVWQDALDDWLNAPMMIVHPSEHRLPLQDMVHTAQQATGGRAIAVANPRRDDRAMGVAIGPDMVYVDPFTGEVLGQRRRGTGLTETIQKIHITLLSGDIGRWIATLGAIGGVLLGLTGLWLWWPIKVWRLRTGKSWKLFHFDLHSVTGIYFLVLTLLMSWTAVHMSFNRTIDGWMVSLLGGKEAKMIRTSEPPTAAALPSGPQAITIDHAAEVAQKQFPEARIRFIQLPAGPKQPFRVQLKYPEDGTPGGRTAVLINPRSGQVMGVQDSRSASGGPWLNMYVDAIHTGEIGGWPMRIAYAMACVAIICQSVTGVSMWWLRWRSRRRGEAA